MCYYVGDVKEMISVSEHLLADRLLFAVIMDGQNWAGTTLLKPSLKPELDSGQVANIVSWSGKHDSKIKA
jgi:hypothetical protein